MQTNHLTKQEHEMQNAINRFNSKQLHGVAKPIDYIEPLLSLKRRVMELEVSLSLGQFSRARGLIDSARDNMEEIERLSRELEMRRLNLYHAQESRKEEGK